MILGKPPFTLLFFPFAVFPALLLILLAWSEAVFDISPLTWLSKPLVIFSVPPDLIEMGSRVWSELPPI